MAMQHCRFKMQDLEEFNLLGPPHPGEIFRDDLLPRLKMTRKALAKALGVSKSTVSRVLNGRRRVNRELAASFARVSGTTVLYWLVLQAHHDAWTAGRAKGASTKRHSRRVRVAELVG